MFDRPTFQSYYLSVSRMVSDQLSKEQANYLLKVDFEEYLQHLIERYVWETLDLDEGAMTIETFVGRAKINDFGLILEVDQPKVRLRIPFAPTLNYGSF